MIGIAGPELPHEVLLAAGKHGGPLPFTPDRDAPQASRWLESKFAPWAAPVLECWLEGAYDHLDAVLFSRADDTSQRLYYYICELRRLGEAKGPEPLIFDIARIPRDISRDRTVAEVRALADRLGVGDASLQAAIAEANARRAKVPALAEGPRCLLVGSAPPDLRLHQVVESAGFVPMGDTLAQHWMALGEPVGTGTDDPAAAIGIALHSRHGGPRSFADPAEVLRQRIAASGAAVVVLWRIEEDEAQCWHLPAERRALEASGLPHLILTRTDWLGRDGAADKIATFLQGLGQ
ncbi:2-hydroxyacyl-CoA dehydratase family protein [Altererythrobacter lauratis]|uniref:2-hydroxyacyl-CoA dehydratase family protein n=1 Tax=Alteraurantiacibacter lauratis TaxID=2054627 RepID=A0ABV7EHV3_9SPHN